MDETVGGQAEEEEDADDADQQPGREDEGLLHGVGRRVVDPLRRFAVGVLQRIFSAVPDARTSTQAMLLLFPLAPLIEEVSIRTLTISVAPSLRASSFMRSTASRRARSSKVS